ncbi:hypothetical protein VNO78_15755 [Psophocarpus tetragonolobus]|uniref:Uncharacterized protein n=1 Tax=Psophocarpus tetragonolobus TaxID=3891 RepID=A0AAN9SKW3_PSOTE
MAPQWANMQWVIFIVGLSHALVSLLRNRKWNVFAFNSNPQLSFNSSDLAASVLNGSFYAKQQPSGDCAESDYIKVAHEVNIVDSIAIWKALKNIRVVITQPDEWYETEINRMEIRDKANKEGRDGGNHGQV